jgi:hypothetical protein
MGFMSVGRVVQIKSLGSGHFENLDEICNHGGSIGLADGRARVS